jgi:hypothetical protein
MARFGDRILFRKQLHRSRGQRANGAIGMARRRLRSVILSHHGNSAATMNIDGAYHTQWEWVARLCAVGVVGTSGLWGSIHVSDP